MSEAFTGLPPSLVLDRDTPCDGCRYNLRGLDSAGRCPECGRSIAVTLAACAAADRRFRPDLAAASRPSRTHWREGLGCVLAAAVLTALFVAAPEALWRRHTVGRVVLLAVAVSAWVVNGLGLWKAGQSDPAVDRRTLGAWLLRLAAVLYTFLPTAVLLAPHAPGAVFYRGQLVVLLLCGVTAVLFHLRLRRLAAAGGHAWWAAGFVVLAVTVPCGVLMMSPYWERLYDEPSLEVLLNLPSPTCASVFLTAHAAREVLSQGWTNPVTYVGLLPVWELAAVALQLWLLRVRAAGDRRSTAPSSRPWCRRRRRRRTRRRPVHRRRAAGRRWW